MCCFSSPPEALWSSVRGGGAYYHTSFHPYISSKKQGEAEHQSDGQYEEVTRSTAGTGSNGHARHAGTARLATASPVGRQRAVPLSSLRMSCADFLSQCACQVMTSSDVRTPAQLTGRGPRGVGSIIMDEGHDRALYHWAFYCPPRHAAQPGREST